MLSDWLKAILCDLLSHRKQVTSDGLEINSIYNNNNNNILRYMSNLSNLCVRHCGISHCYLIMLHRLFPVRRVKITLR